MVIFKQIYKLCIVWLTFKVLKADMGFRCKSSPLFSSIVSGIMAFIRFFAFFYGFLYSILPFLYYHCVYTYVVVIHQVKKMIFGSHTQTKEHIEQVTNILFDWDTFIHFQTAILWIISIIFWTSLPFIGIYGCIIYNRKADFRKGWSRRLDLAFLKLMRTFLGTSRLMVVSHERHQELVNEQDQNAN